MNVKNLLADLHTGAISRRDFGRAAAAAGVGLVTAVPTFGRQARAADLTYYTWAEYELPMFHQSFVDKYGSSPDAPILGDEEEALQKIIAGFRPDISHPCSYMVERWHDAGVIKPVDVSRIEHWDNIWPNLRQVKSTYSGEERWWVPWDWGNSSVIYRTDLVEDYGEDSWEILFDERYAGRLAVYDVIDGAVIVAALVAGVADPFNMTDDEILEVRELLKKQRPLLRFYWIEGDAEPQ